MVQEIITLITSYGLFLVFLNVLVEQAGLPLPAMPTLVVAGALAASERLPVVGVVLVALLACLLSDLAWYALGRRLGSGVLRTLCRISLSPDSCVRQSELRFHRWGGQVLLVAKFVPGLSTVAPPMVGALGLGLRRFLLFDAVGALLWIGLATGLGYLFATQVDELLGALERAGGLALEAVGALLAAYILLKWWQRQRLLRLLRMARVDVAELHDAIAAGRSPIIVDVRPDALREMDARRIPGALAWAPDGLTGLLGEIPVGQELVVYCNCPNEVSAARVAALLIARGYRVRPLRGGLDAWDAAGYPVERPLLAEGPTRARTGETIPTP